jgi:hypothetical protein
MVKNMNYNEKNRIIPEPSPSFDQSHFSSEYIRYRNLLSNILISDIDADIEKRAKEMDETGVERHPWFSGFQNKVGIVKGYLDKIHGDCKQIDEEKYQELNQKLIDISSNSDVPGRDLPIEKKIDLISALRQIGAEILVEAQKGIAGQRS